MEAEFQHLYRVLLPSLNQCGACGVTKCFFVQNLISLVHPANLEDVSHMSSFSTL